MSDSTVSRVVGGHTAQLDWLRTQVGALSSQTTPGTDPTGTPPPTYREILTFSTGNLSPSTGLVSAPNPFSLPGGLVDAYVIVGDTGTTASVVSVYRNGFDITAPTGIVCTANLAGPFYFTFSPAIPIAPEQDFFTVAVTTVGSGASEFTVKLRLR